MGCCRVLCSGTARDTHSEASSEVGKGQTNNRQTHARSTIEELR